MEYLVSHIGVGLALSLRRWCLVAGLVVAVLIADLLVIGVGPALSVRCWSSCVAASSRAEHPVVIAGLVDVYVGLVEHSRRTSGLPEHFGRVN